MAEKRLVTEEEKRRRDIQKLKRYWLSYQSYRHEPGKVQFFTEPTCRACGTVAVELRIPDGACGDPACCSQGDHAEWLCPNLDCDTLTE